MEAGTTPTTKLRPILAALGAALLGALLTLTWINALAAQNAAPEFQDPTSVPYDFTVSKDAIPSVFSRGGGNVYLFSINATGYTAGAATTIYIDDQLPDGVTWNKINTSAWECVTLSTTTRVTCFYSNTNTTTFVPLRINVNVTNGATEQIVNTVTVTTFPPDSNQDNNSDTIETDVDSVDLGLQKTAFRSSIEAGKEISYTLTITNAGPAEPRGVYVLDNVPVNYLNYIRLVSDPDGVTYDSATRRFIIPDNITYPIQGIKITAWYRALDAANNRAITNNASVGSANAGDWRPENNTASATIFVGGLSITKSTDADLVPAGKPFNVTLVIDNPSGADFQSVSVQDVIQSGLELIGATVDGQTRSVFGRTFSHSYSSPFRRARSTIVLTLRPSPEISASQIITNVATLSWGPFSSRSTRRSNDISVEAIPGGWLDVSKTSGLNEVVAGQNISYTVTVENVGSLNVDNITITDFFEQHLTPLRILAGSIGTPVGCTTSVFPYFCTYRISRLTSGQSATFRISARVNQNAPDNSLIINRVVAEGTDPNNTTSRDEYSEQVSVEAAPNYRISASKGVSPSQAQVNESFNFRIRVTNEGDVTIPAVRVTDEFEAVLDLTSVTTNRGTATMNTGAKTIDVNVGDLAPGQEVRIDVVARVNTTVTKVETYDNRAKVTFSGGDIRSNTIRYRVLPGATLPGTGLDLAPPPAPPPAPAAEPHPLAGASLAMLGLGLLGMLAAMLLLAFGLFAWIRKPLKAGGTIRLSLVLAAVSAGLLVGGWALAGSLPEPPDQVGILTGAKPPLATRLAATQTAAEVPAVASGETSETEAPSLPLSLPTDTPAALETQLPLFEPTPTLRALPDYPIPSPTAMVAQGPGGIPPDSSAITRLVIPSIDLDTVVKYVPFDGRTWLIGGLRQEVAWMGDTSWPGLGGNTGLAGHVDLADGSAGPFADLKNLKAGDQIQVYTEKNRFNYTVRTQSVVDDHDLTVVAATAGPQLTLITCTGMDPALGVYLARLIVFADLANVQPLTAAGN